MGKKKSAAEQTMMKEVMGILSSSLNELKLSLGEKKFPKLL